MRGGARDDVRTALSDAGIDCPPQTLDHRRRLRQPGLPFQTAAAPHRRAEVREMSVKPAICKECGVEGTFAKVGRFPDSTDERTYLVGWRCPRCGNLTADMCPVGPIEATPRSCLNCGDELADGEPCAGCGMTATEAHAFLAVEGARGDVEAANAAFERGLYRHAFALLDSLLADDPTQRDAWVAKGRRYQRIGLVRAAARSYERALAIRRDALVEIALGCAQEEAGDHEAAIRTYDALIEYHDAAGHRAIAYGNQANSLSALGRFEEAASGYLRLSTSCRSETADGVRCLLTE
ncbi:MAG: tetratricopeptide repeat protein [Deltaproteobacteria bacterium]|nr:tetratricopeptide repeat protein [Deltaproteobacteria bacterium]